MFTLLFSLKRANFLFYDRKWTPKKKKSEKQNQCNCHLVFWMVSMSFVWNNFQVLLAILIYARKENRPLSTETKLITNEIMNTSTLIQLHKYFLFPLFRSLQKQPLKRSANAKEVFSWAKVKKFNWKKPSGEVLTVSFTSLYIRACKLTVQFNFDRVNILFQTARLFGLSTWYEF